MHNVIHKRKSQTKEHILNKVNSRKGYRHSLETIEKIRVSNLGRKINDKTRQKMRLAKLGKKHSEQHNKNMSLGMKGIKKPPFSQIHKDKIRIAKLGKPSVCIGQKRPQISGEKNWKWIKNRTEVMEKHRIRGTLEWRNWRTAVFARDMFTCRECGVRGGFIEPHHIIPIRSDRSKLFELTNGITLCRPCHQKTIWKESNFADKYSALVAAQI